MSHFISGGRRSGTLTRSRSGRGSRSRVSRVSYRRTTNVERATTGGPVLLLGDVTAPRHRIAGFVGLVHRDMDHESIRRGAVPVVLAGLEEDAVSGMDELDRSAVTLAQPDAFEDED